MMEKSLSSHEPPAAPSLVHPVPLAVLIGVFAALILLTLATVAATWVNLGQGNLWVAMGIATVKATLVALYFMHLRYDNPFYALLLVTGLVFVMLFVGLTLLDTREYQPEVINRPQATRPWHQS